MKNIQYIIILSHDLMVDSHCQRIFYVIPSNSTCNSTAKCNTDL